MSLNAVNFLGWELDWDPATVMIWLLIIVGVLIILTLIVLSILILRTRIKKTEPVAEVTPEPEPAPEPEPVPEPEPEPVPVVVEEEPVVVEEPAEVGSIRYDKSFTAKLIQSDDETKQWYTELKNELLSWDKVHDRMSWKKESYRYGRDPVTMMTFRGKTLCLLFPLDPNDFTDTKYKVEDVSSMSSAEGTPCLYRIKNDRRAKYAKELIALVMERLGGVRVERDSVDYYLPYEGVVELIEKGLIKRKVVYGSAGFGAVSEEEAAIAEAAAGSSEPIVVEEESYEAGTLRYDKSFTAKLIQSEDEIKQWYSQIKNRLLSYKKVRDRVSWKHETYRIGRDLVAKLAFRGKSLCLYLPLNTAEYAESKYKIEDVSDLATGAELPSVYRIKNDRRAKYAIELIDVVMQRYDSELMEEREPVDYYVPYEGIVELINQGLIKRKITDADANAFLTRKDDDPENTAKD